MKQELTKKIVRVGNSAGVILPREWLNGKAKIELVEKPLDIKKDVLEILDSYLDDVVGIYIVGSYARGEQTDRSDVDVLGITNNTNKTIDRNKYFIILISEDKVKTALEKNIIPLLPMLKEAKALINDKLIEKYRETKLTKKNLKWHIELTKSALNVNKAMIDLDKETDANCNDSVAYSLILRLREAYLVDCIMKNKMWSNKELLRMIKDISGSTKAYEGYLRAKDDKKMEDNLPREEAERLLNYLYKKIEEHRKWVKRRKS